MRPRRARPPSAPPTIAPVSLVFLLEGFEATDCAATMAAVCKVEVDITATDELVADGIAFLDLEVVEDEGDSVGVVKWASKYCVDAVGAQAR